VELATSFSWPRLDTADGATAQGSGDVRDEASVASALDADLALQELCEAFEAMLAILTALGPCLMIQVRNDQNNLRKLRNAMAIAGTDCVTVRQLLEREIESGVHTTGPVEIEEEGDAEVRTGGATLADPSAAMALLWLTRSLHFTLELSNNLYNSVKQLDGSSEFGGGLVGDEHLLVDSKGELAAELAGDFPHSLTADCIRNAYNAVIRPYHTWLLRKTFDLVASQVPSFPEVVNLLGAGLGEADRDEQILFDMGFYYREGMPLVGGIMKLFKELQLEDLRRV